MEFAWNTQKNKMTDVKGKEYEQDRKGHVSNPDIDPEKTHLNFDFVESDLNLYQRIKKRVEDVKPVSRVQKNSVVSYSNIITVNSNQASIWGTERSTEYLKEVYNYFCDEFGAENVVSAKVHLDETTPHMHLHFVPVNKENGKLQARVVMDRARINKIHNKAPEYLLSKGFDVVRGSGKTKENIDIHKFKAEALRDDLKALQSEVRVKRKELFKYELAFELKKQLDEIQVEPGGLFNKDKVILSQDDFDFLKTKCVSGIMLEARYDGLLNYMDKSEKEKRNIGDDFDRLKKKHHSLSKELLELKEENKELKALNDDFSLLKQLNPAIEKEIRRAVVEKQRIEKEKAAMKGYRDSYFDLEL